jgi:putative oxidoreductase
MNNALVRSELAANTNHLVNAHTPAPTRPQRLQRLQMLARRLEPHGQAAFLLLMRLLYGWFFIQSGWGKWMHFDRTTEFFASLHLPAPAANAALVATFELVGGILVALGAGTRYASAVLTAVLGTAFATAHAEDAFKGLSAFTEQPPFPFLVATLLLLAFGAGRFSFDGWRHGRRPGKEPQV